MKTEGLLTHLQLPDTCPYPETDQPSPWPHMPLPEDYSFFSFPDVDICVSFLSKNKQAHVGFYVRSHVLFVM